VVPPDLNEIDAAQLDCRAAAFQPETMPRMSAIMAPSGDLTIAASHACLPLVPDE
jgi:hypothetical protein